MNQFGIDRVMFFVDAPYERMAMASEWFDNAVIAETDWKNSAARTQLVCSSCEPANFAPETRYPDRHGSFQQGGLNHETS